MAEYEPVDWQPCLRSAEECTVVFHLPNHPHTFEAPVVNKEPAVEGLVTELLAAVQMLTQRVSDLSDEVASLRSDIKPTAGKHRLDAQPTIDLVTTSLEDDLTLDEREAMRKVIERIKRESRRVW